MDGPQQRHRKQSLLTAQGLAPEELSLGSSIICISSVTVVNHMAPWALWGTDIVGGRLWLWRQHRA